MSKVAYWTPVYICSVCGEHSSKRLKECPFCKNPMKNPEVIVSLCKRRCNDRCNMYCEGYDTDCEDYIPTNED